MPIACWMACGMVLAGAVRAEEYASQQTASAISHHIRDATVIVACRIRCKTWYDQVRDALQHLGFEIASDNPKSIGFDGSTISAKTFVAGSQTQAIEDGIAEYNRYGQQACLAVLPNAADLDDFAGKLDKPPK